MCNMLWKHIAVTRKKLDKHVPIFKYLIYILYSVKNVRYNISFMEIKKWLVTEDNEITAKT